MLKDILAPRQQLALQKMINLLKHPLKSGFSPKKIFATILVIIELFNCVLFDTPLTPDGQPLDLTGYTLVFEDEFEGNELNLDNWFYRGNYSDDNGHYAPSQVSVRDGELVLTGEYLEDGIFGAGWYAGEIALCQEYCRGYFEVTCKCSKTKDFWSAFWLQSGVSYDHDRSQGGVYGAEIDIFEAFSADAILPWNRDGVKTTIHCNGVDENPDQIDSYSPGEFKGKNIYTQWNTYGLEWTEDEYIFYINGVESCRTSFGKGVSTIPETVLLSLCIPAGMNQPKTYKTEFVVDSIRIYQK